MRTRRWLLGIAAVDFVTAIVMYPAAFFFGYYTALVLLPAVLAVCGIFIDPQSWLSKAIAIVAGILTLPVVWAAIVYLSQYPAPTTPRPY